MSLKDFNTKAPSQRQLRVAEQIRHALAEAFREGSFYEPALRGISITVPEVRLSPDLKNAKVFVLPFGTEATKEFVKTLNDIAPHLTKLIAKKVYLKYLPKLYFKLDESFDKAKKLESLLKTDE